MNKSEQLLSAFSEDYFFKELVFDDLLFTPANGTEVELADLIINLQDIIIAIQLKERNETEQTFEEAIENKWLQKRCKNAKGQVKETLQFISSGELPKFRNKRGQYITLNADAQIIPLVVFENECIEKYPHLLRKHSEEGMDINCMSFDDYVEMCRVLISPIEITSYLEYRKKIYEQEGEVDIFILDGIDDELIITKPTQKESLAMQFLAESYGYAQSQKNIQELQYFRNFLHQIPEHTTKCSSKNGYYDILIFLAHMNRIEISDFWDLLISSKDESKEGVMGILHSLRKEDEFAILFVSGPLLPMDFLAEEILKKVKVPKILEIAINWVDTDGFTIDFGFWEKTK